MYNYQIPSLFYTLLEKRPANVKPSLLWCVLFAAVLKELHTTLWQRIKVEVFQSVYPYLQGLVLRSGHVRLYGDDRTLYNRHEELDGL